MLYSTVCCSSLIIEAIWLEISERNIDKISKAMNIPVFKIGSRKALTRGSFEENFKRFVDKSSEEVKEQTAKRIAGASKFNSKIDTVFGLLKYSLSEKKALTYQNSLEFLQEFNEDAFAKWKTEDVKGFVQERLMRRSQAQTKYDTAIRNLENLEKNKKK